MTDDTPRDPLAALRAEVYATLMDYEVERAAANAILARFDALDATRPSGDEALRAALVAAIIDAADIRLPDGRLVIAVRHAAAIIENTALAAPSSAPDAEGLRAAADRIERLRQRDPTSDPDDYWTGWNDALDKAKAALRGFRS
jgi:hypothetical protein